MVLLAETAPPYMPLNHSGSQLVLISEDPFIAAFVRTLLAREGWKVISATAERGLEMIQSGEVHPDLVITNSPKVFLPVADRIHLLYLAAMPDLSLIAPFPSARSLRKPFTNNELLDAAQVLSNVR